MNNNKTIIENFYTSFQKMEISVMNSFYSDQIMYSNPVMGLLNNDEVRSMWELFYKDSKIISIHFSEIELLDEEYATCKWDIRYKALNTGRKIAMSLKSFMRLSEGKIIEHSDAFRLSTWIGQAYGWTGFIFSWTGFMKKKVQLKARKRLLKYMEERR